MHPNSSKCRKAKLWEQLVKSNWSAESNPSRKDGYWHIWLGEEILTLNFRLALGQEEVSWPTFWNKVSKQSVTTKRTNMPGHLTAIQKITDGLVITASIHVRHLSVLKIRKEFHTERSEFKQILVYVTISIPPLHCVVCIFNHRVLKKGQVSPDLLPLTTPPWDFYMDPCLIESYLGV